MPRAEQQVTAADRQDERNDKRDDPAAIRTAAERFVCRLRHRRRLQRRVAAALANGAAAARIGTGRYGIWGRRLLCASRSGGRDHRLFARFAQRGREFGRGGEAIGGILLQQASTIDGERRADVDAPRIERGGGSQTCLSATATGVSPLYGSLPVSI